MLCLESNLLIDAHDPERDGHDDARTFLDRHRAGWSPATGGLESVTDIEVVPY